MKTSLILLLSCCLLESWGVATSYKKRSYGEQSSFEHAARYNKRARIDPKLSCEAFIKKSPSQFTGKEKPKYCGLSTTDFIKVEDPFENTSSEWFIAKKKNTKSDLKYLIKLVGGYVINETTTIDAEHVNEYLVAKITQRVVGPHNAPHIFLIKNKGTETANTRLVSQMVPWRTVVGGGGTAPQRDLVNIHVLAKLLDVEDFKTPHLLIRCDFKNVCLIDAASNFSMPEKVLRWKDKKIFTNKTIMSFFKKKFKGLGVEGISKTDVIDFLKRFTAITPAWIERQLEPYKGLVHIEEELYPLYSKAVETVAIAKEMLAVLQSSNYEYKQTKSINQKS